MRRHWAPGLGDWKAVGHPPQERCPAAGKPPERGGEGDRGVRQGQWDSSLQRQIWPC